MAQARGRQRIRVILGTGVGGGIVIHGRLLAGPNAIAGEWGITLALAPADRWPANALLLRPG